MSTQCKHCGTVFAAGEEPWLKQQEHCSRHDVVHPQGTECTSCVAEREDEANRPAVAVEAEAEHEVDNSGSDSSVPADKTSKRRRS